MSLSDYLAKEISSQLGFPILLFEFQSNGVYWRFCNQDFDYVWGSDTYYASELVCSNITQSADIAKDNITITFNRFDTFAQQYVGFTLDFPTILTIYRGHLTDVTESFVTYWKGRVAGGKASETDIRMQCESIFTSSRRYGLRGRYYRTCRHVLYGQGCELSRASFATVANVSAVTNYTITASEFSGQPDGYWVTGIIEGPDGSLRYITGHSGSTINIWRPIDSLLTASLPVAVNVYPGCDKSLETCRDRFNNLLNHGAFPLIPDRNPFDGRRIT